MLDLKKQPDVAELKVLTDLVTGAHTKLEYEGCDFANVKGYLRTKIESELRRFIFTSSIDREDGTLYHTEQELEKIKKMSCNENSVYSAACIIRSEIKIMKDTMPWPPQAVDLNIDSFNFGDNLSAFLNTVLSGKASNSTSMTVARLKLYLGNKSI